jgi:hypothetical protein
MKARIVNAAPETNPGKLQKLDELHLAYRSYVQSCIDLMVQNRRPKVLPSERRGYFPGSEVISSQILKNAQMHAVQVVETWIKQRYQQRLRKVVRETPDLTDHERLQLRCIGKYLIRKPGKFGKGTITQEMIDLYWSWVWDTEKSGNSPAISEDFPMWLTEMTCVFGPSEDSTHFGWWLRFSSLEGGPRIQVPLAFNPYLKTVEGVAKTVLVRKRENRWVFQFCEKATQKETEFDGSAGKIGVDVGLNCIAATSDGRIYGRSFKPRFDKTYQQVRDLRANRQRQDLKKDSKHLTRLENKLSGQVKTITGTVANKLVKSFPGHTFVIEDLDLKGCKGQKRFAYRALHNSLSHKARIEEVNPAYSSQMCPSCGYVNRGNRHGTHFICHCCGRKSHADVVGGTNLLGRSGDKQIDSCESTSEARSLLGERFRSYRTSSLGRLSAEPKPNGRKLTTKARSRDRFGTASNQVAA